MDEKDSFAFVYALYQRCEIISRKFRAHKILGAETSELAPGRSAFLLADQLLEQSPEGEAVFA
jgi:hypothetical protein